jgi:hypothetical protein
LCEVTGFQVLTAGVFLGFETVFRVYLNVISSAFSSKTSLSAYELHDSKVLKTIPLLLATLFFNVQVTQFLQGPGQALSISGVSGSKISRQSAHEGGQVVCPTHQPPLPLREYSWYSFLLEAESTPRPQSGRKDLINEKF